MALPCFLITIVLNTSSNAQASPLQLASMGTGHKDDCTLNDDCRHSPRLRIQKLQDLQFGEFVRNNQNGIRVTIDPATGNKTVFSGTDLGGRHGPAEYEIRGEPDRGFVIVLPRHFQLTGKNVKGQVANLSVYLPSGNRRSQKSDGNIFGKLQPNGKARFHIGGTFIVKPGAAAGEMRGPLDIFIEYTEDHSSR